MFICLKGAAKAHKASDSATFICCVELKLNASIFVIIEVKDNVVMFLIQYLCENKVWYFSKIATPLGIYKRCTIHPFTEVLAMCHQQFSWTGIVIIATLNCDFIRMFSQA